MGSLIAGVATALLLPGTFGGVPRALVGWNVAVWLYLALVGWMMLHADHRRLQRISQIQAESAGTVLTVVSVASVVSLLGSVVELSAARSAMPHLVLALSTVIGSWLLLPTEFSLSYASLYYASSVPGGLEFPGAEPHFKPDYGDFLYVSMTIAVACQTADVTVTTSSMRRTVLLQSLLSFAFNTAILALTINIAATLFGGGDSRW